ncbi:MAG: acetyl-CoA carboxylase, carboxyltransferase subunit beta [Parvibaculales bacterium]
MNWIKNIVPPGMAKVFRRDDNDSSLWTKCPKCSEMVFHRDLESHAYVCPNCDHHMRINRKSRFASLFDDGKYEEIKGPEVPHDPLKFRDKQKYSDRLKDARNKTGERDAVSVGIGTINGARAVVIVQDFFFMGGSLGMSSGENIITGLSEAIKRELPLIIVTAAGGARMQEGILSLMQMPRTTVMVQEMRAKGLPYIVVLTDPTTGGVTASYGMLGDIHIAEPGALIGFSGPRVIEQTIREKLPKGFQRSEFLLDHGMVDMIVHRHHLPEMLARLIGFLTKKKHDG